MLSMTIDEMLDSMEKDRKKLISLKEELVRRGLNDAKRALSLGEQFTQMRDDGRLDEIDDAAEQMRSHARHMGKLVDFFRKRLDDAEDASDEKGAADWRHAMDETFHIQRCTNNSATKLLFRSRNLDYPNAQIVDLHLMFIREAKQQVTETLQLFQSKNRSEVVFNAGVGKHTKKKDQYLGDHRLMKAVENFLDELGYEFSVGQNCSDGLICVKLPRNVEAKHKDKSSNSDEEEKV